MDTLNQLKVPDLTATCRFATISSDKKFDIRPALLYSAALLAWRGTQAVNGSRL